MHIKRVPLAFIDSMEGEASDGRRERRRTARGAMAPYTQIWAPV